MPAAFCHQRDSASCSTSCNQVPSRQTPIDHPEPDSPVIATHAQEHDHAFLTRLPFLASIATVIVSTVWLLLMVFTLGSGSFAPAVSRPFAVLIALACSLPGAALVYGLLKRSLRRAIEQQLHARRDAERLLIALAATRSGVWEWHLTTRQFHISTQLLGLLGRNKTAPRTWEELQALVHPEDRHLMGTVICGALQNPDVEHSAQYRLKQEDGSYAWYAMRGRLLLDADGQPKRVVGVGTDITSTKEKDSHIERLTYFDPLTGLLNRARFMHMLEGKLEQRKASGSFLLVARIDINRFQDMNNVLGVALGDQVLTMFGHRLEDACGRRGVVSRFAGDDFAIAVSSLDSVEDAQALAEQITHAVNLPVEANGESLPVSAVLGAAIAPGDSDTGESLLAYAELAMVRAREDGQKLGFYQEGMNEAFRERARMEKELATALRKDGLTLAYQPIVRTDDRALAGFEALVRWSHPELGNVPPSVFVPLAESCGLISELGSFVLRTACRQAARWNRERPQPIVISINVSARQMESDRFVEEVAATLAETGLPASCLELEVTESVLLNDCAEVNNRLARLRSLGIHMAVDDFGTGYSSLAALRRLPVSKLKIDRSFVQDLNTSAEADAVVAAILELAHSMNLTVTAEGVETPEQLAFLRARQCQTVQGYLISRPLPAEALHPFLKNEAPVA